VALANKRNVAAAPVFGTQNPLWLNRVLAHFRKFLAYGSYEVRYVDGKPRKVLLKLAFNQRAVEELQL
jgi:hypothetical protein